MSHTDRVNASYGEGALADTFAAIDAVEALVPQLVNLTPTDRMTIPKMGNLTQSFVTDALTVAENNPQFVPPYVDTAGMRADLEYARALAAVESKLRSLLEKVSDTRMLAGSEAYSAALLVYHSLEGAERSSTPGAGSLRAQLASRFAMAKKAAPGNGVGD